MTEDPDATNPAEQPRRAWRPSDQDLAVIKAWVVRARRLPLDVVEQVRGEMRANYARKQADDARRPGENDGSK